MTAKQRAAITKLLSRLQRDTAAQLIQQPGGSLELVTAAGPSGLRVSATLARSLSASGFIDEREPGRFFASGAAAAWLKRRGDTELGFRRQHHTIERTSEPGLDAAPLKNLEESAVAALARRAGKSGEPWLAPHAVAAAERLRRDFEMGQMQPRITANWTASVASGKRSGGSAGLADLTEAALGARLRLDRAMEAVGPDLSGLLADICCFLKGLETVERERQWPARSAKLVLRIALEALARHYGLAPAAHGPSSDGRIRHWGDEGYRPAIR